MPATIAMNRKGGAARSRSLVASIGTCSPMEIASKNHSKLVVIQSTATLPQDPSGILLSAITCAYSSIAASPAAISWL